MEVTSDKNPEGVLLFFIQLFIQQETRSSATIWGMDKPQKAAHRMSPVS
jgi:hypothetical protein